MNRLHTIDVKSHDYWRGDRKRIEFIYHYYLHSIYTEHLSFADIHAVDTHLHVLREQMESLPIVINYNIKQAISIRYEKERLTKHLSEELVAAVLGALISYESDCLKKSQLTNEESDLLIGLNNKLRTIEQNLLSELIVRQSELEYERLATPNILSAYEISAEVSYFLDDNDLYAKIADIALYTCDFYWRPKHLNTDDHNVIDDWNDKRNEIYANQPIWQESHCRLFHELEDHSPVPITFITQIATVWTDINIARQNNYTINDSI